jgi:hypothetical protein
VAAAEEEPEAVGQERATCPCRNQDTQSKLLGHCQGSGQDEEDFRREGQEGQVQEHSAEDCSGKGLEDQQRVVHAGSPGDSLNRVSAFSTTRGGSRGRRPSQPFWVRREDSARPVTRGETSRTREPRRAIHGA